MTAKNDVTVELRYDSDWHDITDDVLIEDLINIIRGRQAQTQRVAPTALNLSILNNDAVYSPRNPASALYGKIGRNTQIRVGCGSPAVSGFWRFHGEIESWPQRWTLDATGSRGVVWVPVSAYGIMRRLGGTGSQAPAHSAMWRAAGLHGYETVSGTRLKPAGWWPLETGDRRETLISPSGYDDGLDLLAEVASAGPHRLTGVVGGSAVGPPGAASAVDLSGGGQLRGSLPAASDTLHYRYDIAVKFDEPLDALDSGQLFRLTRNNVAILGAFARTTPNSGITVETFDGVNFDSDSGGSIDLDDGAWHMVSVQVFRTPFFSTLTFVVYIDGVESIASTVSTATFLVPDTHVISPTGDLDAAAHAMYWVSTSVLSSSLPSLQRVYEAFTGYDGESTADRLTRLADEESIALTVFGDGDTALGPQQTVSVLESMHQAADADGGLLVEARDSFGLLYTAHDALYNQDTDATLSYPGREVAPVLEPSEDTADVANDVTVTRVQGGSSRVVQETGPLNVSEPDDDPQGIGRYPVQVTLSLERDRQTLQQAAWRRHVGTWDDARYPSVSVDLTALDQAGKSSLIDDVVTLDLGNRLSIEDMPVWVGAGDVEQLVQGYTETIGSHRRTLTFNSVPAGPYTVGVLDDEVLGRLDTSDSGLTTGVDETETELSVGSTGAPWIDSAGYASQFPFDIYVDGEVMTVTAIDGTSSPQDFTVTRSVNGVVKSHGSLTALSLAHPLRLAI